MTTLVKFSRDWADEFQVMGWELMHNLDAESLKEHHSVPRVAYFGTNEGWEKEEQRLGHGYTGGPLGNSMEFIEVTAEQEAVLRELFPRGRWGFVPYIDPDDEGEA